MKKKWIWLLLPAALLLLILLLVHSLARLAPSEIGRQVPVLMYHAVGDDCWGEEHPSGRRSWNSSCSICPRMDMRRSFLRILRTSSVMKSRSS